MTDIEKEWQSIAKTLPAHQVANLYALTRRVGELVVMGWSDMAIGLLSPLTSALESRLKRSGNDPNKIYDMAFPEEKE